MKLLYHGPLFLGSTALQRARALGEVHDVTVLELDTGAQPSMSNSLYVRIRNKLNLPVDSLGENARLVREVERIRPEVVLVDNSKVIERSTLARLRQLGVVCLAYYTPDDMLSRYNLSFQLRRSLSDWDIVFTTKSFHLDEMPMLGVRGVTLAGNAFDPKMHRPFTRDEIGDEYETFDCVFVGANEEARRQSINFLAGHGLTVVVYGAGRWNPATLHRNVTLRSAEFGEGYARALHRGKIALGFLRKISRDRITTRSIEIPAARRPLVAEKTEEHDFHFVDGVEYAGFTSDNQLLDAVEGLLADPDRRAALASAGYLRCIRSGYSVADRAVSMAVALRTKMQELSQERVG